MKLRKLARQLAAAAVAGCMALSLCMPALAETWNLANKTQYPYGESAWIEVRRYPAEQKLTFLRAADETLYEYDEEPVFKGSFWTLDLQGRYGTAATVTLQGANIEYPANSHAAMCTMGDVDLTLSGSNAVTHTNAKPAINIDYSDYPNDSPGKLTITGSGSLTATGPSTGVLIEGGSTLDVAGGTVSVTAADNGIHAQGNTVQVNGGTLRVTATGVHGTGIYAQSGGKVQVNSGTLDVTGGDSGIDASQRGRVTVSGGTLTASGDVYGVYADQLETTGGTLTANGGSIAVSTNGTLTVNGGVLNVENSSGSLGIDAYDLEVKNGWLTAKGQNVSADTMTVSGGVTEAGKLRYGQLSVSGGWVEADTLEPVDETYSTVALSGGNVKLKSVPTGTITFSERARLTIDTPVTESEVSALAAAFQSAQSTLYSTAYLRYKPADASAPLPEGAVLDSSGYVVYQGTQPDPDPDLAANDKDKPLLPGDIAEIGTAPAGDAGGAIAAVAIGGAALWGGYEVATRVILHKLLPEGAAIPKTQAQLALLLWNTAGQPEPSSTPAFANVDDATAKAAQWCTEQGYLNGEFKPEKRVAKYNVIRAWNKAFPRET